MSDKSDSLKAARQIIVSLGLPRAQQNERSALCLLAYGWWYRTISEWVASNAIR